MTTVIKILIIGIGATMAIDIWNRLLGLLKIKSLDFRFVGRWIVNMSRYKFFHKNIFDTPSVPNELLIGWLTHYLIGISFAFLTIIVFGEKWLDNPTFLPAITIGMVTFIAPLFIMQPAFGFGIASHKLPDPFWKIIKSMFTHLVYGIGLYLSAILLNKI